MDDNKRVWVPHATDGFKLGKIVDISGDGVVVEVVAKPGAGQKIASTFNRLCPAEEGETRDVDDNCSLMYLNEGTLLNNLRIRYMKDAIYTYVANILIAVNPYKELTSLYSQATIHAYRGQSLGLKPPHIFAIADKAYRDMRVLGVSQSVVVSGESGAGKTESTKYILKFLTECWGKKAGPIEQRIIESNPLLEAFGNAKTMRNNNSSRFGKFVEIHFDHKHEVCGALISHYLLERSRICSQNAGERNYHVFYRMCAGAPEALRAQLKLGPPDSFAYLNHGCTQYFCSKTSEKNLGQNRKSQMYLSEGGLTDIQLDDVRDFSLTDQAMQHMGLSEADRASIYALVAAVLHLGNVAFEEDVESKGGCKVTSASEASLVMAATLLGCEKADLKRSLCCRAMQTAKGGRGGTIIQVQLKPGEAQNARDALAKAVYSRLFAHVVARVNQSLPFAASTAYIGILDIAGFEYFEHNSFEQFCINYCNEKLQQFFNDRILKEEQALYEKEGLKVKKIYYIDNQDCIDLVEAKGSGIFDLLDEENKLPRPSFGHFTSEVHARHKGHNRLQVPRKSLLKAHKELTDDRGFLVKHYAGAVCYQTAKFIEKNNDALHASLAMLATESRNALLRQLFADPAAAAHSGKLAFVSIGSKFRSQLQQLMTKLNGTGTSFIRCIKPNVRMVDRLFEGSQILTQLQCSGMTSVLELMQQGYPSRTLFRQLYDSYHASMPPDIRRLHPRMFCKALFKALGLNENDFAFGQTRVFFRAGKFAEFDQILRSDPENLALLIQKVKRWLVCARWRKVQWGVLSVLKLRNKIHYRRGLLLLLQSCVRSAVVRRALRPRLKAAGQLHALATQTPQMRTLATQLKKTKDASLKGIAGLEKELDESRKKLSNLATKLSQKDIDGVCATNARRFDAMLAELKKAVEKEKGEEERLRRIQEEMEKEKRKKEEDERREKMADGERKKMQTIEAARKKEEQQFRKGEAANQGALKKQTEKEEMEELMRSQQSDQERLDKELALRIAADDSSKVEDSAASNRSSMTSRTKGKYDFSQKTYAQLRDTINTSCDVQLIAACKEEFHRRLKVYHEWKTRTAAKSADNFSSTTPLSLAPQTSLANLKSAKSDDNPQQQQQQQQQRFFKINFNKKTDLTGHESKGWWWAHFDGRWIARQMEVHEGKRPLLLVAGLDDIKMCEMALQETGLTRKRGAEILESDFEEEWRRNGGEVYLQKNIRMLSSHFLRKKLGAK